MRMLERFNDEILKHDICMGIEDGVAYFGAKPQPVPVDINGAVQWIVSQGENTNNISFQYPHPVPPWESAWYEYKLPSSFQYMRGVIGVLTNTVCLPPDAPRQDIDIARTYHFFNGSRVPDCGFDPKWQIGYAVFWQSKGKMALLFKAGRWVDQDGEFWDRMAMHYSDEMAPLYRKDPHGVQIQSEFLLAPVHFANSLAHCKNVEIIDAPPLPGERLKRTGKKQRTPRMTYKTLLIDGIKRKSESERQEGETSVQRALHITRGHFREYSEEKPLFGKYSGRFWIPMHTRGNAASGEVRKDYRVKS